MYKHLGFLVLFSLFFAQLPAQAKGGKHMMKALKQLDLNDEQLEKLKEQRREQKKDHKENRTKIKEVQAQIKEAFINQASDEEFRKLNEQITGLRSGMENKRLDKLIFLKNLLTKEQRVKFMELQENRRSKFKSRRGKNREKDMD